MLEVGVLALQGGVQEHLSALRKAASMAKIGIKPRAVRTEGQLHGLGAIILPGGESTTISKIIAQNKMAEGIARIPAIMGTCAGLILMAKHVEGAEEGQKTLSLLDVKVSRNAYGPQANSFEKKIECTMFGKINAIFIRAPKIISTGAGVDVLASVDGNPAIVVQKEAGKFLLGITFHPELTTTKIHKFFVEEAAKINR